MAYSDIDSGKVLNKEGLLELCNQIKIEIANNSGGGGASYTAGSGISISNNAISLITPNNHYLASLFFLLLKNSVATTNLTTYGVDIWKAPSTKADCISALLNGYIVNPQADITVSQSDLGLLGNFQFLDFWAARNNKTFLTTAVEGKSSHQLKTGRFYYYADRLLVEWRHPVDIWSQMPLYTPDNTFSTIGAYLTVLAGRIPAAPTTDGTYTLQCVVSSGTPTYSWVSAS